MLDLRKIEAITLDLDDTLWPVSPVIERAEALLQDWLVQHAPAAASLFSDATQRTKLRQSAMQSIPDQLHNLSAIRLEMIRMAMDHGNHPQHLAEPAFEVFLNARMEVTLFEGCLPALEWLSQRFPVVAVSNGNADVDRVGIGHCFIASVSARDAGVAKPDPRIFHAAARAVQMRPDQILHIGDDAHLDVVAALEVGMQAAWINRAGGAWTLPLVPHAQAPDLAALCEQLRD
jgi:putative hydrolase of the HAD superfamily